MRSGGGHAGAAGISVLRENFEDMVNCMKEEMTEYEVPEINTIEYDISIKASEVAEYYKEVKKYAPYGEGNPKPVFRVTDIMLSPRAGAVAKYMGKEYEHIKLHSNGFSAICFNKSADYRNMGCPINIDVIAQLSMNTFRYTSELQLEVTDFREHKNTASSKPSSLLEALRLNGSI